MPSLSRHPAKKRSTPGVPEDALCPHKPADTNRSTGIAHALAEKKAGRARRSRAPIIFKAQPGMNPGPSPGLELVSWSLLWAAGYGYFANAWQKNGDDRRPPARFRPLTPLRARPPFPSTALLASPSTVGQTRKGSSPLPPLPLTSPFTCCCSPPLAFESRRALSPASRPAPPPRRRPRRRWS